MSKKKTSKLPLRKKHRILRALLPVLILILGTLAFMVISDAIISASIEKNLRETLEENVQYVEVYDLNVAYREWGSGSDVMILLHGFLGSSYDFEEMAQDLSQNYHIYALDWIGFGLSEKPVDYTYSKAHQADLLKGFVEELGLEDFVLAGHSMGGEIAMRYAASYPADVSHLILLDSAGMQPANSVSLPKWVYSLFVKNYWLQRMSFQSAYSQKENATKDRFDEMFLFNKAIPSAVYQAIGLAEDTTKVTDLLGSLNVPTLILWGNDDTWILPSEAYLLSERIDGSEVVMIPDAGHMVFDEDPQAVVEAIRDFLS
ncbi:MAG: alpha/beta fold hydrolase [Candidatus Izemoplasmatales bacterium]